MPLARVLGHLFGALVGPRDRRGRTRLRAPPTVMEPGARLSVADTECRGPPSVQEDPFMARYISLVTYTDQGIRNIKESPKRLDAAKKLLKELGGELKEFYLTLGAYDLVIVAEAPNDEVVAKFALAAGSLGNVRTTTLKAFPEAEFRKIVAALP